MIAGWLGLAYVVVGVALARVAWMRARGEPLARLGSAMLTGLLWPLWAPLVLEGPRRHTPTSPRSHVGDEVLAGIAAARQACLEAALDPVLSEEMAARLRGEVLRAIARIDAMERTLEAPAFDPRLAQDRVRALQGTEDTARLASASLHARNVERMRALLDADHRALAELTELLRALRSQLALARFAGSSDADPSGIVRDVWSRVEGLGAVIEPACSDEDAARSAPGEVGS